MFTPVVTFVFCMNLRFCLCIAIVKNVEATDASQDFHMESFYHNSSLPLTSKYEFDHRWNDSHEKGKSSTCALSFQNLMCFNVSDTRPLI